MATSAHAFDLNSASAACIAQLAELPADDLEWETVTAVFTLPAALTAATESGSVLLENATECLGDRLGSLEPTLQDKEARQRLVQLPYPALLALLRSPGTRVAAESTAVAAVALWVAAQEAAGVRVTLEQRQQLAYSIRMVQLPFMYLGSILPGIQWLQSVVTPEHIAAITAVKGMPEGTRADILRLNGIKGGADSEAWPIWLGKARPFSACKGLSEVCVVVPAAELNACGSAGQAGVWKSAEPLLYGGYEFGVCLQLSAGTTFKAYMLLHATGMSQPGLLKPAAAVNAAVSCSGSRIEVHESKGVWMDAVGFSLFRGHIDVSAGWQPQQLAPFLHDGNLTIRLTVRGLLP